MRILFFTQNIAPFRIDWINEISKYCDIEVVHLNEYDPTFNKKMLEEIQVNVNVKVTDISITFGKIKVYDLHKVDLDKYDILLLDGYGFIGQLFLLLELRRRKKQCIMSIDGGFIKDRENIIAKKIKNIIFSMPNAFLSTSKDTDDFIHHYSKSASIYRHYFSSIHSNDIITVQERMNLHNKYKLDFGFENKVVIVLVGRFIYIKGFDIIINSLDYFSDNYLFIFIGGQLPKEYIENITDENKHKVKFFDVMNREQLKKYYIASDIFCMPTRGDVWGLVVGEAMACGLPIIASRRCNAAAAMIKKENGIIIDTENPTDYANAIMRLANDPDKIVSMSSENLKKIYKYTIDVSTLNDIESFNNYITR